MRKRGTLLLLAAVGIFLESRAVEQPDFTREQEFITRNGAFVVAAGIDGLFTVSLTNRTIDIKPTNSEFKPCKGIPIDPFEDIIEGEVWATLLHSKYGIHQKMVVWAIRDTQSGSRNRTVLGYTMLLVDLEKCQSKALRLPDETIPSSWPKFPPKVQFGHRGSYFEVYYASQTGCSPCVFDGDGSNQTNVVHQLAFQGAVSADPFHLRLLDSVDGSEGYFYAYNFVDRGSVVELLDYRYRIYKLRYLGHAVDAVSVKNGRVRNVGYCYRPVGSPNELHCDRLDSRLRSVVSVLVPLDKPARKVLLDYDERGNFIVAVVLPTEVRVFVYHVFGELLATLDFGQLQDTQRVRDFSHYIQDKQYCVFYSVTERTSKADDANNVIKCIDTTKYII